MKKLLLIILTAAGFALANTEQAPQDDNSGLYFAAGIGFTYANVSHLNILSDTERYAGLGPYADLRLGWTISPKVTIHGALNASFMSINYDYVNSGLFGNNSSYTNRAPFHHIFVGGGATFYPFINPKSKMRGSHIGVSLGYLTYSAEDSDSSYGFGLDGKGLGMVLELGKIWNINDHWGIGVDETNTIGLFGKETSHCPGHSSDGNLLGLLSFGIQFKITHR